MRVTTYSIGRSFIYNVNTHLSKMAKYQNEVSSGKRLLEPSDDPVGTSMVLDLRSTIQVNEQYARNIDDGTLRLSMSENVLNDIQNLITRARDIALAGANGTTNHQDREIMANEVNQLIEHLYSSANRKAFDNYIFGGTQTAHTPFYAVRDENGEISSISIQGDISGEIKRIVGENSEIKINVDGNGLIFGDDNLFQSLVALRDHLRQENIEKVSDEIGRLNSLHDKTVGLISEVGAKIRFLADRKDELSLESTTLLERKSQYEDTDFATSLIHLQEEQVAYQAALAVGGEILKSTLMNFLK